MKNPTQEFLASFHSLTGETIAQRRKNLYILLNNSQSKEIDFSHLQPKNCLEETFKVEALLYFRRVPDLLGVLKSGNPVLITKVLNASSLFLREAFEDITGEKLVKELFPHLSINTKLKLLNKLALYLRNTEQAEDFFEAVRENYGLHMASKLIACCSGDFTVKSLKANKLEITPRQLMVILKKSPELTETIFEALKESNGKIEVGEKYKNVLVCLMKQDAPLFLKLNEKYKPNFCLGHRATKRFICADKQGVIENSNNIHKLLNQRVVIKSLNTDFNKFYFNLFPTSLDRCKEEYENLLSFLELMGSNSKRVDLLVETFRKRHGGDLWDHPSFVTLTLIEMMSPDERELWMQTHCKPSEITEEHWISFMKTEQSLPLLKERISLTSNIKARAKVVSYLVETCKINEDYAGLADACKYIVAKHHNDHWRIRQGFLKTILSSYCDLGKFEENHWVHINELIEFGVVNNEYYYGNAVFLKAYIQYRLSKNLPVTEELTRWVKCNYGRCFMEEPKHEKQCLLLLYELIPLGYKDDQLNNQYVEFLNSLTYWNKDHPNDQLPLLSFTTAIEHLKLSLKKNDNYWGTERILLHCVQQNIEEVEKNDLLTAFFSCKGICLNGDLLKWLLLHKPSYIIQNVNIVAQALLKTGYSGRLQPLWWLCKNYTHLEIPQKMCKFYMKILETKQEHLDTPHRSIDVTEAMRALSNLMNANDFINLITPYYPSSLTLDVQSDEGKSMCKLQKAIARSIKNINPPALLLESVLQFSRGDYLTFVQNSLYSISHNVPENKLTPFFDELSTRTVSVRKHSIYLAFRVYSKTKVYDLLTKLMKTEKNASIRKSLFKGTFNFFANNPDDRAWEMLKENVRSLNLNDNEAFSVLTKWKRIPTKYIGEYIVFTWSILESLSNSSDVETRKCQILDALTPIITPQLPQDFFTKVTEKYLFKSKELNSFQTKIQVFTSRYVIYCLSESKQDEHLTFVVAILKDYITTSWFKPNTCSFARKSVFNFIKEFCSDFLETKCLTMGLVIKFLNLWNGFLKPHEALDEYLYLQFTLFYLERTTLMEIGEKLYKLYVSLLKLNVAMVNDNFCKSLKLFADRLFLDQGEEEVDRNRYALIKSIMKNGDSANRWVLCVFLLPNATPTSTKLKGEFDEIIDSLLKIKDPSVELCLHNYLKSLE